MARKKAKRSSEAIASAKASSTGIPDDLADADTSDSVSGGMKGGYRDAQPSSPPTFGISFNDKSITAQRFSPHAPVESNTAPALVFTHGAGGGIANPATSSFAKGFARRADVILYQGTMNLQSRINTFHAVAEHCHGNDAALGGRSMGARAAVMAAKEHATKALVLVSYPLVGANGTVRDDILLGIDEGIDILFVSGDGDNMCKIEQLQQVRDKMKGRTWLVVVDGADHGMSLKPKQGVEAMREYTGEVAAKWLVERDILLTECTLRWDAESGKVVDKGWTAGAQKRTPNSKKAKATGAEPVNRPNKRRKKG